MSKVNIFRKLIQALSPAMQRVAKSATRFAGKASNIWKSFVNGKFASRFRRAASQVTEKALGPVIGKQGRKSFAHKLRRSFIPGVIGFAKKHKKALLIGGSAVATGSLLAWLLSKKGDTDMDLSELSESDRLFLENEIAKQLAVVERAETRAVNVDYIKLSATIGKIFRSADNEDNVKEADVAYALDALADLANGLFFCSAAARPYFVTSLTLLSEGKAFDPDYRLHNMRQVLRSGLADEVETNLDRSLECALRLTDDLAFNDL